MSVATDRHSSHRSSQHSIGFADVVFPMRSAGYSRHRLARRGDHEKPINGHVIDRLRARSLRK